MTKEIIKKEDNLLVEYKDKINYIKDLCVVNPYPEYTVKDNDLLFYLQFCKNGGMNPLKKDVYCIIRRNRIGKDYIFKPSIQASIDWFRKVAAEDKSYAGQTKPEYEIDKEGNIISCSIAIKKLVSNIIVDTWATAYFDEYAQTTAAYDKQGNITGKKLNSQWEKMPRMMIAKCAEALALRKSFPEKLANIYTDDEGAVIEKNNSVIENINDITTEMPNTNKINEMIELAEKKGFKKAIIEKKYGNIDNMTINKVNQIIDSLKNLPDNIKAEEIKNVKKEEKKIIDVEVIKDDKKDTDNLDKDIDNLLDETEKTQEEAFKEIEKETKSENNEKSVLDMMKEAGMEDDIDFSGVEKGSDDAKKKIDEIRKNNSKK